MDYKKKAQLFLDVFQARQDVYGKKWVSSTQTKKDGSPLVGYAPQCDNFWKDICYIKTKTAGKTCGNCEHQRYSQVTIESVIRHIKGEEEQCFYVIDPATNMVAFGAMDFDCKPGKEDRGHTFEDVARCVAVLEEWGVLFHIARSTTNGFHLYVFLDRPVEANKMLAFFHQVCEETGLSEQARLGIKPIPEIFPKQAVIGQDGLGNAIKPPMIEPQILKGKNCWVDKNNVMIPADKQWDYMKKIAVANVATIEGVLERCGVDLSIYRSGAGNAVRKNGGSKTRNIAGMNNYVKPLPGTSIEKVLEGCAALRRIRDNCLAGKEPGHDEGFALFHVCMGTHDGLDWFRIHVPGWGKTDVDIKQLQQSLNKNYNPRTCANLQGLGVCPVGTKCFERKPPVEKVHGQWVSRNDIPESQWPDPSPIRYAFGAGDDFLKKLMEEVDILDPEGDATILEGGLKEIISRSRVFDVDQQKELEKHIKSKKLIKPSIVKSLFAEMLIDSANDYNKSLEENDHIRIGDHWISRGDDGHGYDLIERIKGRPVPRPLTRTTIEIHEVEQRWDGKDTVPYYKGVVKCHDFKFECGFEISVADWSDPGKLYTYMKSKCQHRLGVAGRKKMEIVGWAAEAFSANLIVCRDRVSSQGWHGKEFITPSVRITSNEILCNDQNNERKEFSYDYAILSEENVRQGATVLKNSFLACYEREPALMCLSFTIMPALINLFNFDFRPNLIIYGRTGTGKSKKAGILRSFHGSDELIPASSTLKGIWAMFAKSRDALLVLDDFKTDSTTRFPIEELLQSSYESARRVRSEIDATACSQAGNEGLLMITAEDLPTGQASALARSIIVELSNKPQLESLPALRAVEESKSLFRGITPILILMAIKNKQKYQKIFDASVLQIGKMTSESSNGARLAKNFALVRVGLEVVFDFFEAQNIFENNERLEWLDSYLQYEEERIDFMIGAISAENKAERFVSALHSILASGRARIVEGSPRSFANEGGVLIIGFKHNGDVYLIRETCKIAVEGSLRLEGKFEINTVGKELFKSGYIEKRNKLLNHQFGGTGARAYWIASGSLMEFLGLSSKMEPNNVFPMIGSSMEVL